MRNWSFLVGLLVIAISVGCSKKKEEAAKLEQEMMAQESAAVDTGLDTAAMPVDTMEAIDVGAIPDEEEAPFTLPGEEKEGYAVQVAACESQDYAQYLVEKYTGRGYEPYLTKTTVEGQTYYRVRIGGIETLQAARELKHELLDKYSVQAWIEEVP